jgi:hypothetical protein
MGRVAFKPYLDAASDLWDPLSVYWCRGLGDCDHIVKDVAEWPEGNPDLADARRRVGSRVRRVWRDLIIVRLVDAWALAG